MSGWRRRWIRSGSRPEQRPEQRCARPRIDHADESCSSDTEFNLKDGTLTASEEAQKNFIVDGARQTCYRAPSKVTGFIVYELFDEENHETAVESRYGLVRYTPGLPGTPGPDKAAYGAMQALIRDMPR